jgi:predicted dehydrogenase
MKKIRTAILGTGFMGRVHTEALRRLGNVEVVAVAGSSEAHVKKFAQENAIERSTAEYRELLKDPQIDVVHICTPNDLHFPMVTQALEAGKHVLCEKPLATSVEEGEALAALAENTGLVNCTLFNARAYPQTRNMHAIVASGDLGEIWAVQGTYSQDWLLLDTDWNWRINQGPSRTFADIGSHWFDLAEFVTGLRTTSICADLQTFHKTRKRPNGEVETFSGKLSKPGDYTETPIETEDFGSAIFRMGETARGAMTVSQISAGRKNRFSLEVFGTKGGLAWDGERPDELWIGRRNEPNQLLIKDPSLMRESARSFADLPGGHSEGFDDTFKQTMRRFYAKVADPQASVEYPRFVDGVRQLKILDSVLESSRNRAWVDIKA